MSIANINSLTSQVFSQRDAENKNKLGQQEFLHLLVTQMRNQDPMNPLDGTEFASQLAQFNSVEQLIGVNDELKKLKESHELMSVSMINSMATSLTGKHVKALSNQVSLSESGASPIQFRLNNTADKVEIIVRNASGGEVRKETLNGMPSGNNHWQWDGLNNEGVRMSDGEYTVEIKASNDGDAVNTLVFTEGIAQKVQFRDNGVYLMVNNIYVPIGDVQEVGTETK